MCETNNQSGDLLGIRPYGETAKILAKGTVDGAGAFLGRICLPAAEEFGFLLKDKVSGWRKNNAVKIASKAQKLLEEGRGVEGLYGHPRLVMKAIEDGSWADTPELQDMWAGLLASSCTEDGKDEANLIFMNLLNQLTSSQAKVIRHSCENAIVQVTKDGLIHASGLMRIPLSEVKDIAGVYDIQRIDRELDHLRELGLIVAGILLDHYDSKSKEPLVDITPTPLMLHLYIRCQGSIEAPPQFFNVEYTESEKDEESDKSGGDNSQATVSE